MMSLLTGITKNGKGHKRTRDTQLCALDDGSGPLLFYSADRDGVSKSSNLTSPLLHPEDRNRLRGRSILSNFYKGAPLMLAYEGALAVGYETSEHAYQSLKYRAEARILESGEEANAILASDYRLLATGIRRAKTANRAMTMAYMRETKLGDRLSRSSSDRSFQASNDLQLMEELYARGVRAPTLTVATRYELMVLAVHAKFTQNPLAREYLLSTGTRTLIEHTTRDVVWGDGGTGIETPDNNYLGKALMRVRAELSA
jgi:hypothetical protein